MKWVIRFYCLLVAVLIHAIIRIYVPDFSHLDEADILLYSTLIGLLVAADYALCFFAFSKYLIRKWDEYQEVRHKLSVKDLSYKETKLIQKYRCLDDHGKAAVLNVLNHEYESLPGEKAGAPAKEA